MTGVVLPPWSNGDWLRERQLRPGPQPDGRLAKAQQRERFYVALVATTGEHGYDARHAVRLA